MGFLLNVFLNPIFLAATATAGVPVVIHMIHRRQAPRVLFSTLRFLRISVERTARRRRIEDLLLLILRSLLFFLLAFALAKPFFRAGGAFGGTADTSIAIVLDNSASLGIVHGGERRFARAKEIARTLISPRNLRSGRDSSCLLFTNGPEAQVEPILQTDLQKVEAAINESDLSVGFADLTAAVERAAEVLAASDDPNRELYVVTDMQANSWEGMGEDSRLSAHADIPLVVINCGSADYENLAAADLRIEGQGQVVEVPVTIRTTLYNPSSRTVSRFVSLYVNRAKVDNTKSAVSVPPNSSAEVKFVHTFRAPGRYAGWVRIDNDSLDLDNQRNFTVAIAERVPILLVKDEQAPVAYLDEGFFLRVALNPFSLLDTAETWALDPKSETPGNLTPAVLRGFPVVFLLNCRGVTPEVAATLADYVRQGGGLVIGLGGAVRLDTYNEVFGSVQGVEGGLLPARLVEAVGDVGAGDQVPRRPDQTDLKHYLMKPFAEHPSLYQRILVNRFVRVERPLPTWADTILSLDSGDPLILERRVGSGRVVLVTTSLNNAWTNMPASTFYAIAMQRLAFYLVRQSAPHARSYTAGTPVRIPFPGVTEPTTLDVTTPSDETIQVRTARGETGQEAVFGLTFRPGVYTYESLEHQEVRGAFAVNPDPAEANLTPMEWQDLRSRLPVSKAYYATDVSELRERVVAMREGVQLWNLFLFVVLMLAVFECFVANRTPSHPS